MTHTFGERSSCDNGASLTQRHGTISVVFESMGCVFACGPVGLTGSVETGAGAILEAMTSHAAMRTLCETAFELRKKRNGPGMFPFVGAETSASTGAPIGRLSRVGNFDGSIDATRTWQLLSPRACAISLPHFEPDTKSPVGLVAFRHASKATQFSCCLK